VALVTVAFIVVSGAGSVRVSAQSAQSPAVLIVYDSAGTWGYLGGEYTLMLRNLLGHFSVSVTTMPARAYSPGTLNSYAATFYIGSTYDEASFYAPGSTERSNYNAFVADAARTTLPLVWVNHNLWRMAWAWDPSWDSRGFSGKFGIGFSGIHNALYNRVSYKNTELLKGVVPHANPGADLTGCTAEPPQGNEIPYACSPELNLVMVTDPVLARVHAFAYSTFTGARNPYITQAANLWVVGDLPFSYFSEEDRYLAFADVLHDMLGINHAETHRALVRLEDVSAVYDDNDLNSAFQVLTAHGAPFSVATIPIYRDPLGMDNNGTPRELRLSASSVGDLLTSWQAQGVADIVHHGTTHQWDPADNPFTRVSGDDFEFYRVTKNPDGSLTFAGPLPGDSAAMAISTIGAGQAEFAAAGLTAFAWEAPHYAASAVDYSAIATLYNSHYGRLIYFAAGSSAGRFVGQFYPYVIESDAYGYRVLPENLGYIDPTPYPGYRALLPADLIRSATKALVVRDGFASFFYHPNLGTTYLDQVMTGIQSLGYTFVAASSIGPP
jgi:uncharacterized protein YdaL